MAKFVIYIGFILGLLGIYLVLYPVPIDPVAWTPGENPEKTGILQPNDDLAALVRLFDGAGVGPEDTTIGPDGQLYTGYEDGRIVRFDPHAIGMARVELFSDTGGRPLGMQFAVNGDLIVADGLKGLLAISPTGASKLLTNRVDGTNMIFVDDLDVSNDGKIWFSDASQRFGLHDNLLDFFESQKTGRLLSYDPATGITKIELSNLGFANGVALAADESFVLVNETFRQRVTRLWLTGSKSGQSDIFSDNLPGHPDNISRAPDGTFWVALVAPRIAAVDGLMPSPFWRKVIMRLPEFLRGNLIVPEGWVVQLNAEGEVIDSLQDTTGHFSSITSVNEHDGVLYFGSITETAVGQLPAP